MSDGDLNSGRVLDAQLHLLDRQVLDVDGVPVTAVDDLELTNVPFGVDLDGTPAPVIESVVSGAVLGTRIFGGRAAESRWNRIPWRAVRRVGTAIELTEKGESFEATWPERWVRDRIIARIPGGRHAP